MVDELNRLVGRNPYGMRLDVRQGERFRLSLVAVHSDVEVNMAFVQLSSNCWRSVGGPGEDKGGIHLRSKGLGKRVKVLRCSKVN